MIDTLSLPQHLSSATQLIILTLLYTVFTGLCSLLILKLWPKTYTQASKQSFSFIFCLNFCLPVCSFIALGSFCLYALKSPYQNNTETVTAFQIPVLPTQAEEIKTGLGAIQALLAYENSSEKKHAIITAIRNMPDKEAIPILRILLLDEEDDIRLLAYAILDKKESSINEKIHTLKQQLKQIKNKAQQAHIYKRLCECHWELAYLGIAENDLQEFVIKKAAEYGNKAQALHDDIDIRLLLGKIYLSLKKPANAKNHLNTAKNYGALPEQVLPYLADAAFQRQDYAAIPVYLQQLPANMAYSELEQVKDYWL